MFIQETAVRIDQVLSTARYYPCVLLVHPELRRLEAAVQQLSQYKGWPLLAVSRCLADVLAGQPGARRSTAASTALDRPLTDLGPGPVICTDLALLFEPVLELDALAMLRRWSRRVPVIAAWPGTVCDDGLAYAVPAHAHYRLWHPTGLDAGCIMPL
jgi:hypothetical protein